MAGEVKYFEPPTQTIMCLDLYFNFTFNLTNIILQYNWVLLIMSLKRHYTYTDIHLN